MSILDSSASAIGSVLDPIAAKIKAPFTDAVKGAGERPQDFPEGWEITEYANDKVINYLQLLGNLMPMIPFEWDSTQHMSKEYYPGNKEAVVHLMGFRQGPVTIKGRFKDKRYKSPDLYGVSYQFVKALEEIAERGNILKFGFEGPGGSWIRWGILEKPKFKMNKLSWIDYELTFVVISDTKPVNDFFSEPEKQAPDSVNTDLIDAAVAFQATYSAIPSSMPASIAGKINQFTSGIAQNINKVTGFVQTVINTGQDINAAAHRALGLIKNARQTIASQCKQVNALTHSFSTLTNGGETNKAKTIHAYKHIAYVNEAVAATLPLSQYLQHMQTQFELIAKTIPIARYRVKLGDTLQNISIKFYGVSDYWSNIYDHNKLQDTILIEGAVLEIPRL